MAVADKPRGFTMEQIVAHQRKHGFAPPDLGPRGGLRMSAPVTGQVLPWNPEGPAAAGVPAGGSDGALPSSESAVAKPVKVKKPWRAKQPNKTEQRFRDMLDARKRRGEFAEVRFEGCTLRLADGVKYTPDFMVIAHDGTLTFYEVKGAHIWDDARVKFKVAREQNKWAAFEMWQWKAKEWRKIA